MRENVHLQRQASQFTEREATGRVRAQITQQGWAPGRWQPLWARRGGGQVLRMAPRPHPRASWALQPKGSGGRVGVATEAPAPCQLCPVSASPNWLGEVLGQQLADTPQFPYTLGWDATGTRSMPPASLGRQEDGPQGVWRGGNPQAGSWWGEGVRAEERDGALCRTSDIGGRAAGHRVFGYQMLAGTGPGFQGPGQGQKPLAGGTGSGTGTRPQSRC